MRLSKYCLGHSPNVRGVEVVVTDGWPKDKKVLDDAAAILLFSDGSDIEVRRHPLLNGDRLDVFARQVKRGCKNPESESLAFRGFGHSVFVLRISFGFRIYS